MKVVLLLVAIAAVVYFLAKKKVVKDDNNNGIPDVVEDKAKEVVAEVKKKATRAKSK